MSEYYIDIDIIDKYICRINYRNLNNDFEDLGFLVKMSINNKKIVTGILTRYYSIFNFII